MLKAIELYGFKSFVDKTRFEFPHGITVIVGPNGSGKSNVVDAIKWVLGAQSARSLRGKEMADVIFKGSGSGHRKPANSAEATIVFDNSDGRLDWDAAEVHVTRRVYRSGEGEYLINGEACRLRDIKDLFRGTGVGADAYSLIEQGKVDTVLQASPKERRAIFEEAAGISRFKAKKVESQRRLERVEQNMLRLTDIVEEVGDRLRRLKSQAGKAQRYQQYTARMQALRTQVGQVDWQRLSGELTALETEMGQFNHQIAAHAGSLAELDTAAQEAERQNADLSGGLRTHELAASRLRERMASNRTAIEAEGERVEELTEEQARHGLQLMALERRCGDLDEELSQLRESQQQAWRECEASQAVTAQRQSQLAEAHGKMTALVEQTEAQRQRFVEAMRESASLGTEISGWESTLDSSQRAIARSADVLSRILDRLQEAEAELQDRTRQQEEQSARIGLLQQQLAAARDQLTATEAQREEASETTMRLKQREIAIGERAGVLEEIESRMEGIGSGVKQVLGLAQTNPTGPLRGVRGMVADLIEVNDPALAELVDVALGDRTQHLVVAGSHLFEYLEENELEIAGRVGFLRLQSTAPASAGHADLTGQYGVIGRALDFVTTGSEYEHLLAWLLGDTWFVEQISDAIQLSRAVAAPLRFVTRRGDLFDRDGRLVVGPHSAALGLISRRTELRELHARIAATRRQLVEAEKSLDELHTTQQAHRQEITQLRQQRDQLSEELSSSRALVASATEKVEQLRQRQLSTEQDQAAHARQKEQSEAALAASRARLADFEAEIRQLEQQIASGRDAMAAEEVRLQQYRVAASEAEVASARSEQQLEALNTRLTQMQRDQSERSAAIAEARQQAERCQQRLTTAELAKLTASAQNATFALQAEQQQHQIGQLTEQLEQLQTSRQALSSEAAGIRQQLHQAETQLHQTELQAERIRHERDTLAQRLHEDYGITVADLQRELSDAERAERAEVDAEIADLRRKLDQLGAVNLDALSELEELEGRHAGLSEQYQDLIESKDALERIIHKIDADSRRLFIETLEAIRANFSALFRKVFGGGRADIVLEEDVDILDSGIDIIATPPGKQSLGLSLLSGGERALTAVTLLLAVFQYRPSPFCVLDEVDGPLDEANIGRFLDVLNEFLAWTKFVIVTHSKKTMTCANTLYGVTMQESGVSKRVSVRFEDVGEHGVISDKRSAATTGMLPDLTALGCQHPYNHSNRYIRQWVLAR